MWCALAAVLVYLPTLRYGFVWDDHSLIEGNPLLRAPGLPLRLVTGDFWAGPGATSGFWRPLILLGYWLDARLAPGSAAWPHAVNAVAHALASGWVAALLAQSGAGVVAALLGGLWFATHPIHVESVAFVSGRTDLLCAVFLLGALWLDRRARRGGRRWPGWGAPAALGLALLSKEAALAGVAILGICEWCERSEGATWHDVVRWLSPYVAVTVAYLVLHASWVGFGGTVPVPAAPARWAAGAAFTAYLALLLPGRQPVPGMGLPVPSGALAPEVVLGIALQLLVVVVLAVLTLRRARAAVPLALFWLPLVPLTAAALAHGRLLFAGRFLYLPSAGVAWLLGLAIDRWARGPARGAGARLRSARGALVIATAGGLVVFALSGTLTALPVWSDDSSLYGAMVAGNPRNPEGYAGLVNVLLARDDEAGAAEQIRRARRLAPPAASLDAAEAALVARRGDWSRVLALADDALRLDRSSSAAPPMRAMALMNLGRVDEAITVLDTLRRAAPGLPGVELMWGECLVLRGRAAEALPALERAAAGLGDAGAWYALGAARGQLGQTPGAREAFARAVMLDPAYRGAWLKLAEACAALGDRSGRDAALARAAALRDARDGTATGPPGAPVGRP